MDNTLRILVLGLVIIATITVPVVAEPQGPLEGILVIVTDIQAKVAALLTDLAAAQTDVDAISTDVIAVKTSIDTTDEKLDAIHGDIAALSTDVATVKTTTSTINQKVDALGSRIQMVTKSREVFFGQGTLQPSTIYNLAVVTLNDDNKAADFRVNICNTPYIPGDWSREEGDLLTVSSVGSLRGPMILVRDDDLSHGPRCHHTEFTGKGMAIYLTVGGASHDEFGIRYAYTVTTESGVTIDEQIWPPP